MTLSKSLVAVLLAGCSHAAPQPVSTGAPSGTAMTGPYASLDDTPLAKAAGTDKPTVLATSGSSQLVQWGVAGDTETCALVTKQATGWYASAGFACGETTSRTVDTIEGVTLALDAAQTATATYTIHMHGHNMDNEPGEIDERTTFALACRIAPTPPTCHTTTVSHVTK